MGREILGFVDAAVLGDDLELPSARRALLDASGPDFVLSVAGVLAAFQMMNRLLDATGAPVHPSLLDLATELGLEVPAHLRGDLR